MPDLNGFHTQEVPLPQQKSFKIENINGRPYRTVTWSQYVMFPQITGKLKIPEITFNGLVVQQNRNVDPFEAFFNGGSGYVEVKKQIKAPGMEIQVDPLPTRPANFSGGVGEFKIAAHLEKTDLKVNDALKFRIIISGVGNFKLIRQPLVKFPKDFDQYDAKVTDQTKLSAKGVEGSISYDFIAVPRHPGKFEIPPVEFVYYDTSTHIYKTVKTEKFSLNVANGSGSSTSMKDYTGQENLLLLDKDIRYIKTGETNQHDISEFFFGSFGYWGSLAILAIIFISLFVIFRQRAIEAADIVGRKAGSANKVATKRLKRSAHMMSENMPSAFYDEVLRALWGYVGDKLNIPVEQLSHDNISERLSARHVDSNVIQEFIEAIDECEFERYAPGDPKGNMKKVFEKAMNAIEKIENSMKKNKKNRSNERGEHPVIRLLFLFITLAPWPQLFVPVCAENKAVTDSAYAHEQYQKAA